jgi:hypothetical protein
MHKGFKCLEISSGRVYVSRDVVFDETEFPFSKLHSNAGARLKEEISFLPFNLLNPFKSEQYGDHVANLPDNSNASSENSDQNRAPNVPLMSSEATGQQNPGLETDLDKTLVLEQDAAPG